MGGYRRTWAFTLREVEAWKAVGRGGAGPDSGAHRCPLVYCREDFPPARWFRLTHVATWSEREGHIHMRYLGDRTHTTSQWNRVG